MPTYQWHFPTDEYRFTVNERKPVAELWDADRGVRVAIVYRADNWPKDSYSINVAEEEGSMRWLPRNEVPMQGSFLEARDMALALVAMK